MAIIGRVLTAAGRAAAFSQPSSIGAGTRRALAAGLLASAGAGALSALVPAAALALVALGVSAGTFLLVVRRGAPPLCLGAFLLVGGYIVLNRGFAGLYLPLGSLPLYLGELALPVLLLAALGRLRGRWRAFGPPAWWLAGWMALNGLLTLPHLLPYGIVAIRDAAIWYYGLYAIVGAAVWHSMDVSRIRRWFVPVFLVAFLSLPASLAQNMGLLPPVQLPIGDSPLIGEKWDIATMFLVGGAALFLTGGGSPPWPRWATPLLVAVSLVLIALPQYRASFIGLVAVFALLVAFRQRRVVAVTIVGLIALLALLWAANLQTPSMRGIVSTREIIERQLSTLRFAGEGTNPQDENDNTVYWRVIWWQALWDDAVANPPILILGRGYGPDLRDVVIGLETATMNWDQNADVGRPVRSPHNIAMTILARSGMVGFSVWLLMLAVSFWHIARATLLSRRAGEREHELLGIWLIAYLAAILIVALFGVVLESPMGAIPFFFLLGIAIAWSSERLAQLTPHPGRAADAPASAAPDLALPVRRALTRPVPADSRAAPGRGQRPARPGVERERALYAGRGRPPASSGSERHSAS